MQEMRLYEYAVIRIVPRIEREEFVNVGLIMMCKRHKWLRVELLPDTDRLRAISGKTDTAPMLKQLDVFKVVSAGAGAFALHGSELFIFVAGQIGKRCLFLAKGAGAAVAGHKPPPAVEGVDG